MDYQIMCNGSSTDIQNAADWISTSYDDWTATASGSTITVTYTGSNALIGEAAESIVQEIMNKPPVQSANPTSYN